MKKLNLKLPDLHPTEISPKAKKANKIFGIINIVLGALMLFTFFFPLSFANAQSNTFSIVCEISAFVMLGCYVLLVVTALALLVFLMATKQKLAQNFGAICIVAVALFLGTVGLLPFTAIGGGISMLLKERERKEKGAKNVQ